MLELKLHVLIAALFLLVSPSLLLAADATNLPLATNAPKAPDAPTSGIDRSDFDPSIRPQDDLFGYANGTWLKNHPIPADRSSYGETAVMQDQSLALQRGLLEAAMTASSAEERKAGDLYASFMNDQLVEQKGLTGLETDLRQVSAVQTSEQLGPLMGHLYRIGITTPIAVDIEPDHKDSAHYAFYLNQGGIGLPDRDYFLLQDKDFVRFRAAYLKHIAAILEMAGDQQVEDKAKDIMALEAALAQLQWSNVALRDPLKTYNPKTLEQLQQMAPAINWPGFFSEAGIVGTPKLVVGEPSFVAGLPHLVTATPLATWKAYFRFRILSDRAAYLSKAFVAEDFDFNQKILNDTPHQRERWKRGCDLVDQLMGEESGKLYVAKYFPATTKAQVQMLVMNLINSYRDSIDHLDWMSPATRAEARAKLDRINVKIGYPDRWRDYSTLSISADDLIGNVERAHVFEHDRKAAMLSGPVDHSEWDMTAPTVNAYYSEELNEIVFPAGTLQPPAFDPNADDAYNYGSTGATIGHEISHAFDDEGSQYDASGNLRDWWTKQDYARFKAKTTQLVKEYNAFQPIPGFHINGALTLGENIADIAGIEIAYKAYLATLHGAPAPVIDGMTGEQRFYLGFAQSWLGEERKAALIAQLKSDPHSPEKYRVNGVVVHMPSFYQAFSVTPSDKMFLAPKDRVTLW